MPNVGGSTGTIMFIIVILYKQWQYSISILNIADRNINVDLKLFHTVHDREHVTSTVSECYRNVAPSSGADVQHRDIAPCRI